MSDTEFDAQDLADMAALKAGDDLALNALMDRHGEKLFHYLIRLLQDEGEAADLAQETFVRVFQNRDRFDPANRFSTWLYTIATNLARNRFRWRARHPQVSLEAETTESGASLLDKLEAHSASPASRLEGQERAEAVREALAALPEELRTPLVLAEYEEMSQAEIARVLSCSVKAVENRIYRARQRLRQLLSKRLPSLT